MSAGEISAVILAILTVILLVKVVRLHGLVEARAHTEARERFERWKNESLKKDLSREVEVATAGIRSKAANDVEMARQQARLDLQKWKFAEEVRIRQDSALRSTATHIGKVTEHLVPWFLEGAFDPRDIRFIGSPIDLIVFHGLTAGYVEAIHFIEVKSGKSPKLSPREELVRGAATAGRLAYSIVHLSSDGSDGSSRLNWLGNGPPPQTNRIMNEELRSLMEKKARATAELEFEVTAEIETLIFENFGRTIAKLADEIAVLREELRSTRAPEV